MPELGEPATTGSSWILWWRVAPDQLKRQVAEYNNLPFYRSLRGISMLLLLFSIGWTLVLARTFGLSREAYIGAALMAFLALFINQGHRWAMIGAMVYWTLEKLGTVMIWAANAMGIGFGRIGSVRIGVGSLFFAVLFWCIYMHAFYFAFLIEQRRRTFVPTDTSVFD